ncbi:zinc finger protein containing cchc type domain containing protein [Lasius niger]|uniref:Zinc finger protein containing cchc type domain containing protein n=1 Tax=Lasius niger TaxID=67767 RepID=A0A0J7K131_LASNI|nr:zinc finger protein containing cchc type domain containing protein [Lasius niger]
MILERDEERPGFWADLLAEVARLQADQRCARQAANSGGQEDVAVSAGLETTCGASEASCDPKADTPQDAKAEAQMDPPPTEEEEACVESPRPPTCGELEEERRTPIRVISMGRRPRTFPGEILGPTSLGCWRCGGPDHFFRECPRRREGCAVAFCYRCGRLGTTVRDCPKCREGWLAQGPYVQGRGHAGPEPPRRRGLPPPMRLRENAQPPSWL